MHEQQVAKSLVYALSGEKYMYLYGCTPFDIRNKMFNL